MARETGSLMPPMHILNAPTRLMKNLGYGKGYVYDHATEEGFSGQNYFPDGVARREFYRPGERGFEREIKKRLDYWDKLRRRAADGDNDRRRHRDGAHRGRRRSARPLVPAALSRVSATAGSKSCCAPGRSGSTASAPAPAIRSRRARRSGCRRLPRRPSAAAGRRRGRPAAGRGAAARSSCSTATTAAIVLNKPAGLAVQGGTKTGRHVDGLLDTLRFDSDERPRLVHRLDKDTSGVLLIARTRGGGGVLHPGLSREDDAQDLLGGGRRPAANCRRAGSTWRSPKACRRRRRRAGAGRRRGRQERGHLLPGDRPCRRPGRAGWRCCRSPGAPISCAPIAPRSARRSSATANMAAPPRISPEVVGGAAGCTCMPAASRSRSPAGGTVAGHRAVAAAYARDLGILSALPAMPRTRLPKLEVDRHEARVQKGRRPARSTGGWGVALDGRPMRTPGKQRADRAERSAGRRDRRGMGRAAGRDPAGDDAADPPRRDRDRPHRDAARPGRRRDRRTTPAPTSSAIAPTTRRRWRRASRRSGSR